ncbi:phosphoribosylamine--glycine ligase [Candidatus Woesearchaeota archaeon]|nr:phosphoribosylamine--glycine ligase [Candidatus Woesearchaeota archaeon]
MNILLVGNAAREHVVAETLKKNSEVKLYSYMKANNPGIASLSEKIEIGNYSELEKIKKFAKDNGIDFSFVGPEDPLNEGVVDALLEVNVESIGPKKVLAKLETSKSFTRDLLKKYNIEGNPGYKTFTKNNITEIQDFFDNLEEVVIKPDGLTGGKGVKVQGDHFDTKEEALAYCKEVLESHESVIVEEKLDGEEFSFQCLTDGKTVVGTPIAQDHKRAYEDDKGPNTGGMGSYTFEDHLLPFLKKEHVDTALKITQKVADAIKQETGEYYRGVMYGGFILGKNGIKLIEYNARLGDPEAMNVLPLFKTDFVSICKAMISQELGNLKIEFEKKATVCKYAVPEGYPEAPVKNEKVEVPSTNANVYYASVDKKEDGLYMSGSRAIAFVGIADTLEEAEQIAEEAVSSVKGKVFHRKDIGTKELIQKRMDHVNQIFGK